MNVPMPERITTRYAVWSGGEHIACWAYRAGQIDCIVVADYEGRVGGQFVRYVHYAAPGWRA